MDNRDSAAFIVRNARQQAGLSQRQLAVRAQTSQSVIARIESGQADPRLTTVQRLLSAAGFALTLGAEAQPVFDSHMLEDVQRILRLSPEERLVEIRNINRFVAVARRV